MWDAKVASMPRSAKDVVKHAEDIAKHAEDVARHAKDGLGRCKHALGTHINNENINYKIVQREEKNKNKTKLENIPTCTSSITFINKL